MNHIDWSLEVNRIKTELLQDTVRLLQIKSVLDESTASPSKPFGKGIDDALRFMLDAGKDQGFQVKNVDGYAGHIEFGDGEETVGILCHIDVVPEGDDWTSPPFAAKVKDGKIIARGAIDDKGPTMAAFYAMKLVKELNLSLSKKVRLIIGTDEESTWKCVDHYFKKEEMPTIGFAPDADFPIIHAEKGICDVELQFSSGKSQEAAVQLLEFHAGRRLNMVPDESIAILEIKDKQLAEEIMNDFQLYLEKNGIRGTSAQSNHEVQLKIKGKAAHGMEPNHGINAAFELAPFLQTLPLLGGGKDYIDFIVRYLSEETRGRKLHIACSDTVSGPLTVNAGLFQYSKHKGTIGLNIRYPVTKNGEKLINDLRDLVEKQGCSFDLIDHSVPHYVKEDTELIQTLSRVYEEQTGEKAELLAIGGGTYARSLEQGVAFGPLFPGREDVAHQPDEYVYIDDLVKATAIYAQAIYELAK